MGEDKKKQKKRGPLESTGEPCVLAAVDFTEHSVRAVGVAATWAKATGTKLLILHVVHDPAEAPGYYGKAVTGKSKKLLKTITNYAEELMAKFMGSIKLPPDTADVLANAETMMVSGSPVTRILEVAAVQNATMIVVGSHGRTGVRRLLLGSKAARVANMSPVPVTIVKPARAGEAKKSKDSKKAKKSKKEKK